MKKILAAVLSASLLFTTVPPAALACGGPEMDDIDFPLQKPNDLLQWLEVVPCQREIEAACGFIEDLPTIPELLFLNPFRLSRPKETADLWKASYEENGTTDAQGQWVEYKAPDPLSLDALHDALQKGAFDDAVKEAQSLFDQIMNMPVALAENNQDAFHEALEVLELKPLFGKLPADELTRYFSLYNPAYWPAFIALSDSKLPEPLKQALIVLNLRRDRADAFAKANPTNPRLGTLRFIALKEAMRTQIPDGWREEIAKKMTTEAWKSLEAMHDQWFKDFPDHPLTDLVKLSKLRLAYLQNNEPASWKILFDLYPKRPIRAVAEMRFLLKQGFHPNVSDIPNDPVLLAALTPWIDFKDGQTWTTLWKLSEANTSAPWAVNFQERLLDTIAMTTEPGKPLPEGFPQTPKNPSPFWGQLRLFALYKAGQYDKALEEGLTLKPNAQTDAILAKIYLKRGDWTKAMALSKLPMDSKRYVIRVLLDDAALKSLLGHPQKEVAVEAHVALAVHLAAKGDWNGGAALIDAVNPAQASLWRDAAKLASDKSATGLLAWARFLRKNDGKLFYKPDTVWYRSLFSRLSAIDYDKNNPPATLAPPDTNQPWQPDQEQKLLMAHFTSLEPYLALQAYAAWLEKAGGKDPHAKAVLKEADKTYNWLVNWANNYSEGWQKFLDQSAEAQIIRRVGKEL